jgi:hypothetical protein
VININFCAEISFLEQCVGFFRYALLKIPSSSQGMPVTLSVIAMVLLDKNASLKKTFPFLYSQLSAGADKKYRQKFYMRKYCNLSVTTAKKYICVADINLCHSLFS